MTYFALKFYLRLSENRYDCSYLMLLEASIIFCEFIVAQSQSMHIFWGSQGLQYPMKAYDLVCFRLFEGVCGWVFLIVYFLFHQRIKSNYYSKRQFQAQSHVYYITMKSIVLLSLAVLAICGGLTFVQLQQKLMSQLTSPLVSLMFVFDGASEMGPALKQVIEDIATKKEGYFKVLAIDCDTDDTDVLKNFPYCSDEIKPKLPALFFTEPELNPADVSGGEKPEPKNHVYQGNLQEKSLYEFAIPLMKLYSLNLKKSSDWAKFKETYPQTPKVLYFTDKEKIPPFYKALTANFRSTIAFGHVFKNSTLCEELGVDKFPTLLLDGKTKIQLTSNLLEMIAILKQYQGSETKILIQDFKQSAQSLNEDNIDEKIYQNSRHILVHIPGANGQIHAEWKKCQDSFKKMFDYFETETLASRFGVKHRPAIIYFPKSLVQKDVKKTIFYPSDNFRTIYDDISGLIEDFTVPVASDIQMQQLTSLHLTENRLIAVLFHKQDISLSYRVLSNDDRFKESFAFIRMKDPAQEVLQKFQIKKLPALFIMTKDDSEEETEAKPSKKQKKQDGKTQFRLQLAQFTGKFNYDELETYLKYFTTKPQEQSTSSQRELSELNSRKRFQKQCVSESCYLLLLDNSPQKKSSNEEYVNNLKGSMSDVLQNVGFVDAKCHSQILTKLQIYAEQLPVLVYLNNKFQKYSRLIGRIEQKSIALFKAKVKANKGIWRGFEKIVFENKNCQQEHQKLKKLEGSGYEMTDEQAQILEQIKKQQQKKKEEAGISDTTSKKRRKKRRPRDQDSEL